MADENYFEDAADTAPESTAEDATDSSESKTALLPKDFFGSKPLEVGAECKVKIVKVMDDEVQVEYVPHGTSESDTEEAPMPMKDDTGGMMEDMG